MIPTTQHQHIALKHSFGLNGSMRNSLHMIDDQRILYASGYQIIQYNIQDETQIYFNGVENFQGFSCFNLSPLKRYLAVGLKGEKPAIVIFDTKNQKRKKTLKLSEEYNVKEFVSIIFSPEAESKNIISLTAGGGDCILSYWQYDYSKCLASIKISQSALELYEIGINHNDVSVITVLGLKTFKCYRLIESIEENNKGYSFKNMYNQINGPNDIFNQYSGHLWLKPSNQILVCGEFGELVLLSQEGAYDHQIEQSPKNLNKFNWKVATISQYSKGFVVGGHNLSIYVYKYNGINNYDKVNIISIKKEEFKEIDFKDICSIGIAPSNEDKIYCTLTNNIIMGAKFKYDLNHFEQETTNFDQISMQFHYGQINDIDVCIRKPLIVSCGSDKYVKVWNYEEKRLEISKHFPDESKCVSIHPSGYQIVVGSSDKLKMITLVNFKNQLKIQKEITLKQVKEVQYSNGGQYFAAVTGTAVNSQMPIMIYSSYTGENVNAWAIRGHTARIKSIKWSRDDRYVVSCGVDGQVNCWRIAEEIQRMHYFNNRQCQFQSACMANDMTIYSVTKDRTLRIIPENNKEQQEQKIDLDVKLSQLCLPSNNKILFAAVNDEEKCSGEVRCYKFTYNGVYTSYQAHESSGIEKMKLTFDDMHLVTCGKDGVINVFEVKDKEVRSNKNKEKDCYSVYSQEILITKADLDEIYTQIKTLNQNKRDNQSIQNTSLQLQAKEEEIQKMTEGFNTQHQSQIKKFENYRQQKQDLEKKYQEELKMLAEFNEQEMTDLDTTYQRKVMTEVANYEEAKRQQDLKNQDFEKNKQIRKQNMQQTLNETDQRMFNILEQQKADRIRLQQQNQQLKEKNKAIIDQIKFETNQEIKNIELENEQDIKKITDKGLKCKSDVKIKDKQIQQQVQETNETKDKIAEAILILEKIKHSNIELQKENEKHKLSIDERDKQITDREKKIYELKKRSQELEKFKFVLDHRIKELRRDIGPREKEIQKMKDDTNKMDKKLKKLNSINNTLGAVIDELDQSINKMKDQIKSQRQQIQGQNVKIKQFKNKVYQAVQHILDYDMLKQQAEKLLKSYVNEEIKPVEIDPDIKAEYSNQKVHLQKCVDQYTKNLAKDNEIHKQDNIRIMRENVDLIWAIKKYRKQLNNAKFKKPQVDDNSKLEQQINEKKQQIQRQNKTIEQIKIQIQELDDNSLYG